MYLIFSAFITLSFLIFYLSKYANYTQLITIKYSNYITVTQVRNALLLADHAVKCQPQHLGGRGKKIRNFRPCSFIEEFEVIVGNIRLCLKNKWG